MIGLETLKKLKELDISWEKDWCYYSGGWTCPYPPITKDCPDCEHYLPNPSTDELIDAIDKENDDELVIEQRIEDKKWFVWFYHQPFIEYQKPEKSLKEALAQALIWLYGEEVKNNE